MNILQIDQVIYPGTNFTEAKVIGIYPAGQGIYSETHYELLINGFKVKLPISLTNGLFVLKETKEIIETKEPEKKLTKKKSVEVVSDISEVESEIKENASFVFSEDEEPKKEAELDKKEVASEVIAEPIKEEEVKDKINE